MVKVAINGFGRIGRLAFRIWLLKHHNEMEVVAINTSGSMDTAGWCHLLMHDTTYRKFEIPVTADQDNLIIESMGLKIPVLAQKDPELLPWSKYGVDVVMECTGKFTDEPGALKHAKAGAKKVIISAPHKGGNVGTYVLGVSSQESGARVLIVGGAKGDKEEYTEKLENRGWTVLRGGLLPGAVLRPDGLDISDEEIKRLSNEVAKAETIVLAGPMGKYQEVERGTREVFAAVADSKAYKVAGGGDTEAALEKFGLKDRFDWISVGGGAMLEFLATGTLVGIEALA